MCGIAGIYSRNSIPPSFVKEMTDLLFHRGPDDEGYLLVNLTSGKMHHLTGKNSMVEGRRIEEFNERGNLFLGHRRLAIIDLSPSAHQPMSNDDGNLWVVYNGEIYNYVELREELKKLGYSFTSNSDTEVLLKSYEAWGERCVDRFNGMWAFVIYDRKKSLLFGSRDITGVKPLYYYIDKDLFLFASEIKALLSFPFLKTEINPEAVFLYLVFGYENPEEVFFKNIHEVLPAHSFFYDLERGRLKVWRYYRFPSSLSTGRFRENLLREYSEKTRELLFKSIFLRLRSDVPVGTCLSGGLDSSTVACVINELVRKTPIKEVGERQKVFTAVFEEKEIDESHWAERIVKHTGAEWYRVSPTGDELMKDLDDLIYTQEMPFASTSVYAQFRVMRLAKEAGIKVLLDGQGGDEIFAGYPHFYTAFFLEMLKGMRFFLFLSEFKSLFNSPVNFDYILRNMAGFLGWKLFPSYLKIKLREWVKEEVRCLNPDFWHSCKKEIEKGGEFAISSLNALSVRVIEKNLRVLLRYEDRNSMRFSIEARTPFADDRELIDYQLSIPSSYKIHKGWSKYILRCAVKSLIPEEIRLRRDKKGFVTPEKKYLSEKWEELKEFLHLAPEFINGDEVMKRKDYFLHNPQTLWRFINLCLWKKRFFRS